MAADCFNCCGEQSHKDGVHGNQCYGNNSSKENTTHFYLRELGTTSVFAQLLGHVRMTLQSSSVMLDVHRNRMVCYGQWGRGEEL